jgi:hypothetical protein
VRQATTKTYPGGFITGLIGDSYLFPMKLDYTVIAGEFCLTEEDE